MSVDRLRYAANVLDHWGTSTPGDGTTVVTEPDLYRLAQGSAAVLRAVADEDNLPVSDGTWLAAVALADTILGGTDD